MYPEFRVWDLVYEEMMYEGDMDNYIIDTGEDGYFHLLRVARFYPQMYIGLKDRNGKKIYEGDIITLPIKPNENLMMAEVVWKHAAFRVKWLNKRVQTLRNKEMEEIPYNINLWEVIGNKYENPELLKEVL